MERKVDDREPVIDCCLGVLVKMCWKRWLSSPQGNILVTYFTLSALENNLMVWSPLWSWFSTRCLHEVVHMSSKGELLPKLIARFHRSLWPKQISWAHFCPLSPCVAQMTGTWAGWKDKLIAECRPHSECNGRNARNSIDLCPKSMADLRGGV